MSKKALLVCRRWGDVLSLGAISCQKVREVVGGSKMPLLLGHYDGGCGPRDLALGLLEESYYEKDKSLWVETSVALGR